jgi:two-component system, NarL family, response regulator LiaR
MKVSNVQSGFLAEWLFNYVYGSKVWYKDTRSVEDRQCNSSYNNLHAHNTPDRMHDLLETGTFPDTWIHRALLRSASVDSLSVKSSLVAPINLISVLIADAHPLPRQRLSRFLMQQDDIQVVGEATNSCQVLNRVATLQPHILLLDPQMPKMSGLEGIPRIRAKSPPMKILILTDSCEDEFIARALQAGVHGCVLQTVPLTELVKAIRTTHAGEFWVPRRLLAQVVETLRQRVERLQGAPWGMWEVLSDREHEVVRWAAQGMTNTEIATQLGISAKTVKTHLQNVFRKLRIGRRAQLLRLCPT